MIYRWSLFSPIIGSKLWIQAYLLERSPNRSTFLLLHTTWGPRPCTMDQNRWQLEAMRSGEYSRWDGAFHIAKNVIFFIPSHIATWKSTSCFSSDCSQQTSFNISRLPFIRHPISRLFNRFYALRIFKIVCVTQKKSISIRLSSWFNSILISTFWYDYYKLYIKMGWNQNKHSIKTSYIDLFWI